MADYNPKDVPILDDVIERADNKKTDAETIESALVDYNTVDKAETSTIDIPAIDIPVIDKQTENQPVEVKQQTSTANSLLSVTDDIVKQLMPKLELHLRLLLRQALKENLPEESSRKKTSSTSNTDS